MNGKNKKVLAGLLATSLVLSGAVYATTDTSTVKGNVATAGSETVVFMNGDVNQDANVSLDDAQLALKGALKIKTDFTELQLYAADVDSNDVVDLTDAQLILKHALKIQDLPAKAAPATEAPSESEVPTEIPSEEPSEEVTTPTPTPPVRTTPPTLAPIVVTTTPAPKAPTIPAVEAADYVVSGQAAVLIATNGAVEEDGIFTFTAANKTAVKGLQYEWPFSGRTDMRRTAEQAGLSLEEIQSIPEKYLIQGDLETILAETGTIDYDYPRPEWDNGISISFWSKQKWEMEHMSNAGPLLVIKRSDFCDRNVENPEYIGGAINYHGSKNDCDFGLVVFANGSVSFLAGDHSGNRFRAASYFAGEDDEWTHFTITLANDFITVYVNGQEMVYQSINFVNDEIGAFNGGYMTKYNPAGLVTPEMLGADIRGYLTAPTVSTSGNSIWYKNETDWEASLLGNDMYSRSSSHLTKNPMLLMDLLTEDNVEMFIGGTEDKDVCCIQTGRTGSAAYNTPEGSQVSGVTYYESELEPDEVAAIYEDSKATYKDILGLE